MSSVMSHEGSVDSLAALRHQEIASQIPSFFYKLPGEPRSPARAIKGQTRVANNIILSSETSLISYYTTFF